MVKENNCRPKHIRPISCLYTVLSHVLSQTNKDERGRERGGRGREDKMKKDRQTHKQMDRHTNKDPTSKQTNKQTNKQRDKQTTNLEVFQEFPESHFVSILLDSLYLEPAPQRPLRIVVLCITHYIIITSSCSSTAHGITSPLHHPP